MTPTKRRAQRQKLPYLRRRVALCGLGLVLWSVKPGALYAAPLPHAAIEVQVPVRSVANNQVELDAGWHEQLAVGMSLNLVSSGALDKVLGQIRLTVVEADHAVGVLEDNATTAGLPGTNLVAMAPYPLTVTAVNGQTVSFFLPRDNRALHPGDTLTVLRKGEPIAKIVFSGYRPVAGTLTQLKPGTTPHVGDVVWAYDAPISFPAVSPANAPTAPVNNRDVFGTAPPVVGGTKTPVVPPSGVNGNSGATNPGAITTLPVTPPPSTTIMPGTGALNAGPQPLTPGTKPPLATNPRLSAAPAPDVFALKDKTAQIFPAPDAPKAAPQDRLASAGSTLSRTGATGLIRMPSAEVTGDGQAKVAIFGDTKSTVTFVDPTANRPGNTVMTAISVGFLPRMEVGGTIGNRRQQADLTVNGKIQIVQEKASLPAISIGIAELKKLSNNGNGQATKPTYYAAASKNLLNNRVNVTGGLVRQAGFKTKPYGGVEVGLTKQVSAVIEHDSRQVNYGLRASVLRDHAQVGVQHLDGRWSYAVGGKLNLNNRRAAPASSELPRRGVQLSNAEAVAAVQSSLVRLGLENVTVRILAGAPRAVASAAALPGAAAGTAKKAAAKITVPGNGDVLTFDPQSITGNRLEVSYENRIFPHNEIDALANVMATAAIYAPSAVTQLSVVIKRSAIPIMRVACPLDDYLRFMSEQLDDRSFSNSFATTYKVDSGTTGPETVLAATGKGATSYGHADVFLRPGLTTALATETYILGTGINLLPELNLPLTRGTNLDARGVVPILGPLRSQHTTYDRIALNYSAKLSGTILARAFAGRFPTNRDGVLAEALLTPDNSRLRLRAVYGTFKKNSDNPNQQSTYLGEVRYYLPTLDLTARLSGGRYIDGDKGGTAELRRRFGDTEIGLEYRDTDQGKVGLVRLGIPLGPNYLKHRPSTVRVRPPDFFDYSQRSGIKGANFVNIASATGNELAVGDDAGRSLLDRDHLNRPYLLQVLPDLRSIRPIEDLAGGPANNSPKVARPKNSPLNGQNNPH